MAAIQITFHDSNYRPFTAHENTLTTLLIVIFIKLLLDCDWFISVQLIPYHSAIWITYTREIYTRENIHSSNIEVFGKLTRAC
jgi:hypothetical protein